MPRRRTAGFAVLAVLGGLCVGPAVAAPDLAELRPIPLQSGANVIPEFAAEGRTGMVVLGWRENGNAHGYDLAVVLLQQARSAPWNIVHIDPRPTVADDVGGDSIVDDPHTGEDMVKAFRFAHGQVDGKAATLLLVATREVADVIPAPAIVAFDVYQLVHAPQVGTTEDHFVPILRERSPGPFCNADMALSRRFNLPLRSSYQGPKTADGCPAAKPEPQ